MSTECPSGCGRRRRTGQLMCPACWSEVPRHLQRDVQSTWRRWRRDLGNGEALRAYRAATDAALTCIR